MCLRSQWTCWNDVGGNCRKRGYLSQPIRLRCRSTLERCVLDGWLVVARVGLIAGAVRRVTAWREVETKK